MEVQGTPEGQPNTQPTQNPSEGQATQPAAAGPAAAPQLPATQPTQEPGASTFEATGNANLDYALGFIGNLGFGVDHPAVKAAEAGNFGQLEAELAKLGTKAQGYEAVLRLAQAGLGEVKAAADAKVNATREAVHKAVGGEEAWKAIETWATSAAEPAEKEQVNQALALGGVAAEAMAEYLASRYARATGTTITPKDPAPGSKGAPSSEPLTQAGYINELRALRAQLGGRLDGSQQYADLQKKYARVFR